MHVTRQRGFPPGYKCVVPTIAMSLLQSHRHAGPVSSRSGTSSGRASVPSAEQLTVLVEEFLDGAWFVTCQIAQRGCGAFVLAGQDRPFARDEQFRLSGCHAGFDKSPDEFESVDGAEC